MSTRRVYTPEGEASWFLDVCRAQLPEGILAPRVHDKAVQRLNEHAEEVRESILYGNEEGQAALAHFRDTVRCDDARENRQRIEDVERRAMTSTVTNEFVTPQYITAEWIPYRSPMSSFAQAARQLTLPDVGMQLHVPGFSSATTTAVDTLEAVGLPHSSPSAGYVSDPINVNQAKGAVTVSQQLLDRGGAPDGQGGAFDIIMAQQLHAQMEASMDLYVINTALAGATAVTDSTTVTTTRFWTDINKATEQLSDVAGTRLQPTHVHTTSDFGGWVRAQVDSENRPIWIPDTGAVLASPPQGEPFCSSGYQGVNFVGGGGSWFIDDNIPASSTNSAWTQVIVWNNQSLLVWKSATPLTNAIPFTREGTQDLSVFIYARQYIAAFAKFAGGIAVISGSGYANLS